MTACVPDIFTDIKKLRLPATAYIFGSGPNGVGHYENVPRDACCLALNSAINMDRDFDWWMAFDLGVMRYKWWAPLDTGKAKLLFGHRLADKALEERPVRHRPDYSFKYRPTLTHCYKNGRAKKGSVPLFPGRLRGAVSIAGCAVQFLHFAGVKTIVLVGCDMMGEGHWDGQINPGQEGVWAIAPRLSWLCNWISRHARPCNCAPGKHAI